MDLFARFRRKVHRIPNGKMSGVVYEASVSPPHCQCTTFLKKKTCTHLEAAIKIETNGGIMPVEYTEGDWKSFLQKSIRRCRVEDSVVAATSLFQRSPESVIRRIPIVAAEDCVYTELADTVAMCINIRKLVKAGESELALRVVAQLARRLALAKKEKSSCWLVDLGRHRWTRFEPEWEEMLVLALDQGQAVDAAGLALIGLRSVGYQKLFDLLAKKALVRGSVAARTAEAARWRIAQGGQRGCDGDILIGASVLSIYRSDKIEVAAPDGTTTIPSEMFDVHTGLGKTAIELAARKLGRSTEDVGMMQFLFVGAKIENVADAESEFRDEALEVVCQRHFGKSLAEAMRDWESINETVASLQRWVLRKNGKLPEGVEDGLS